MKACNKTLKTKKSVWASYETDKLIIKWLLIALIKQQKKKEKRNET